MKKQSFILWSASIVIIFVIMYISNITSENYPVTSTFSIDGKKISYRFERIHYGSDSVKIIIRNDLPDLKGRLFWKINRDTALYSSEMKINRDLITGVLPPLSPGGSMVYHAKLFYRDKSFILPPSIKPKLIFYGKIPPMLNILEFTLLYIFLIFAVRSGLSWFDGSKGIKKFGISTLVYLVIFIMSTNPLYLSYKFGFINHSIPLIKQLFYSTDLITLVLWIITLLIIFQWKRFNYLLIIVSIITLILFAFFR